MRAGGGCGGVDGRKRRRTRGLWRDDAKSSPKFDSAADASCIGDGRANTASQRTFEGIERAGTNAIVSFDSGVVMRVGDLRIFQRIAYATDINGAAKRSARSRNGDAGERRNTS